MLENLIWEEKVHMTGFLSIYAYPGNNRDEATLLTAGHNLILDVGRGAVAALQRDTIDGGVAHGVYDLGFLALGNGSGSGASVPTTTTTALFNETTGGGGSGVARKNLSVSTPPPGPPFITNLWSAQIGPTELNNPAPLGGVAGNIINEAALVCLDDTTFFSMRTFANQTKSSTISLEFRWTIIF
jgi:hypothetical protein